MKNSIMTNKHLSGKKYQTKIGGNTNHQDIFQKQDVNNLSYELP